MSDQICRQLEARIHREIPVSRFMGVRLVSLEGSSLVLEAALEPNINVHNTAFAGSLYSICALAGWALVTLLAESEQLDAEIVVARGEIKYIRPVTTEPIVARAVLTGTPASVFDSFLDQGKARARVETLVEQEKTPAVIFSGNYALTGKAASRPAADKDSDCPQQTAQSLRTPS